MAVNDRLTDGVSGVVEALLDATVRFITRRGANESATVDRHNLAVVVTGGSAGIGFAIATEFAKRGRRVLLVARNSSRLADAAATIRSKSTIADGVATHVVNVTASDAAVQIERALDQQGWTLDILVNAAGTGLSGPFVEHSEAEIGRLLATNVIALTTLTRWALPRLLACGSGGIINVASIAGYVPGPNQAAYYASKAFVCSLTSALHAEAAWSGVRVLSVSPGPVDTGFHAAMGANEAVYRRLFPAIAADRVARAALKGYALRRRTVVPGALQKFFAVVLHVMPEAVSVPLMKALLANPRKLRVQA